MEVVVKQTAMVVLLVALVLPGCYMGVLRRQASDIVDRRVVLAQEDARDALEVIAPEIEQEDGSVVRVLLDPTEADIEDVDEALNVAATALAEVVDNMAVVGAWTECMKDDHGHVKEKDKIELGSEEERIVGCQYAGKAKSRAWIKSFFRGAWGTVTGIWNTIKWTYRAVKWGLAVAVVLFAYIGFMQWRGKRFERTARREYSDVFDEMKANGEKGALLALLKKKACAMIAYEGDRKWRAKHLCTKGTPEVQR